MSDTLSGPCERYRTRLDAHLATLKDDAARRAFCDREHAKWIERYEGFQARVARGEETGDETCWHYVITLCDVEHRRARYALAQIGALR